MQSEKRREIKSKSHSIAKLLSLSLPNLYVVLHKRDKLDDNFSIHLQWLVTTSMFFSAEYSLRQNTIKRYVWMCFISSISLYICFALLFKIPFCIKFGSRKLGEAIALFFFCSPYFTRKFKYLHFDGQIIHTTCVVSYAYLDMSDEKCRERYLAAFMNLPKLPLCTPYFFFHALYIRGESEVRHRDLEKVCMAVANSPFITLWLGRFL